MWKVCTNLFLAYVSKVRSKAEGDAFSSRAGRGTAAEYYS